MPRALLAAISGSGEPVNGILAAELNGRPGAELVFGCSNGQVYAYAPSRGEELWRFESGETVHDRPVAIDWNGDGTLDVVAWDDESVHVIDGRTGEPLDGFPQLHRPDGVAVADLDGDGTLDIVGVERGARRLVAWRTTLRAPVGDAGVNDAPCGDERESGTR
jgi:hypothetical protein